MSSRVWSGGGTHLRGPRDRSGDWHDFCECRDCCNLSVVAQQRVQAAGCALMREHTCEGQGAF